MKKILMAHDLSYRSTLALGRAVQLAQQTGAALEVFHVVEDDLPAPIVERRKAEAKDAITGYLSSIIGQQHPEIRVVVVTGRDYTAITGQADRSHADLIVLGIHREDALRQLVIGSTAERIIGFGSQPVLVVKDPPRGPYHRVVISIDASHSSRRTAEFALTLLPDAEFRLVQASPVPWGHLSPGGDTHPQSRNGHHERPKETKKDALIAIGLQAGTHATVVGLAVHHGPPLEIIREEVRQFHPDLLVIGIEHRAGLTRALIGDIAESLLAQLPCDILAIHV
jgi:nucleotide-binding universal stress UspA family protein